MAGYAKSNTFINGQWEKTQTVQKTALSPLEEEKILREDLAAGYRIADMFGWTEVINNHISVRLPGDEDHFLINPYGQLYSEITASSLVTIDVKGNIIHPGTTNFGVNPAGFVIHGAIHASRKDAKCICHTHPVAGVAVAATKHGLLPISQNALIVGDISYHDYFGPVCHPEEQASLIRDLGKTKVIFLRNHGLLTIGETIGEAIMRMFFLIKACEIQVSALAQGGIENIIMATDYAQKEASSIAANYNGDDYGSREFAALKRKVEKIDPSYKN